MATIAENATSRLPNETTSGDSQQHPNVVVIDGERFVTPQRAASILVEYAGSDLNPLTLGKTLKRAADEGRVRRWLLHQRAGLYHEGDLIAEARRLGDR